jgi:hypothetical protein
MNTITKTIAVVTTVSLRVGQVTRETSCRTSSKNLTGLVFAMIYPRSNRIATPTHMASHPACFQNDRIGRSTRLELARLGLAGVEGLEPPTPGFGDRCSTS